MTGLLVRKLQQTQTYSDITKCQSRLPYTEILKFSNAGSCDSIFCTQNFHFRFKNKAISTILRHYYSNKAISSHTIYKNRKYTSKT